MVVANPFDIAERQTKTNPFDVAERDYKPIPTVLAGQLQANPFDIAEGKINTSEPKESLLKSTAKGFAKGAATFMPKSFWGGIKVLKDVADKYPAFTPWAAGTQLIPEGYPEKQIAEVEKTAEYLTPEERKGWTQYIPKAAETLGQMAGSAVSTAGVGTLPAMAGGAGIERYLETRKEGYSVPKSLLAGGMSGTAEYVTEKLPIKYLTQIGLPYLKRLAGGLISDVPGEIYETFIEMKAIDEGLLGKKYTPQEYAKAILDTAATSAMTTGIATTAVQPFRGTPPKRPFIPEAEEVVLPPGEKPFVPSAEAIPEQEKFVIRQPTKAEIPEFEPVTKIGLIKRYVNETGEKIETEADIQKVKNKYPEEYAKIEVENKIRQDLWDKLPEEFKKNRGINEYTTPELQELKGEIQLKGMPIGEVAPVVSKEPWQMTRDEWQGYADRVDDMKNKPFIKKRMETGIGGYNQTADGGYEVMAENRTIRLYPTKEEAKAAKAAFHEFFLAETPEEILAVRESMDKALRPAVERELIINDMDRIGPISHKEAVRQALSEGKPVPPEVLKDYPELQKTIKMLSFSELPDYAKGAIASEERVKATNTKKEISIKDITSKNFIEKSITIEDIQKTNPQIFKDTFVKRGSVTKGNIVIDKHGKVIDGNNRVREAFEKGKLEIGAFVEIVQPELETKKGIQEGESLTSRKELAEQMKQAGMSDEEVETNIQLGVDASAKTLGITPDEFIQSYIGQVKKSTIAELEGRDLIYEQSSLSDEGARKINAYYRKQFREEVKREAEIKERLQRKRGEDISERQVVKEEGGIVSEPEGVTPRLTYKDIYKKDADRPIWLVFKKNGEEIARVKSHIKDKELYQYYSLVRAKLGADTLTQEEVYLDEAKMYYQSQEQAQEFYSHLEDVIEKSFQARYAPQQLLNYLKAQGVKDAEIEATGLKEYLKERGNVSKDELLEYLKGNQVEIKIINKQEKWVVSDRNTGDSIAFFNTKNEAESFRQKQINLGRYPEDEIDVDRTPESATKFSQWVEPGGENYKEILLTLPQITQLKDIKLGDKIRDKYSHEVIVSEIKANGDIVGKRSDNTTIFIRFNDIMPIKEGMDYRSTHYDEPNIVAHIRVDDRTDTNGKKVLFVEEIQSDWAANLKRGKAGVPPFPFSKTWHELALKHVLRYASENGYDSIAWTSGEMQRNRYDLSKQIKSVFYDERGGILKAFDLKDNNVIHKSNIKPEEIENYIGKEPARKLLEQKTPSKEIHGLDLKVGGEWAKRLYDEMIPQYLNKYTKKWGGKVGEAEVSPKETGFLSEAGTIETPEGTRYLRKPEVKGMKVKSLDITPSMSQSILKEGQPLFQDKRGAIEFTKDGKAIIHILENADKSTFIHEMFHLYVDIMQRTPKLKAQLKILETWIGKPVSKWTVADNEKVAKGGEKYLWEGNAPTSALKAVFERFKTWLREVYKTAKSLDIKLSDDVRKMWDEWFGGKEITQARKRAPLHKEILQEAQIENIFKQIKDITGDSGIKIDKSFTDHDIKGRELLRLQQKQPGLFTKKPNAMTLDEVAADLRMATTDELIDKMINAKSKKQDMELLAKQLKEYTPPAELVTVSDLGLKVGDKFKIYGEQYAVKEKDAEGNFLIEDGDKFIVNESDKIQVPDEGSLKKGKYVQPKLLEGEKTDIKPKMETEIQGQTKLFSQKSEEVSKSVDDYIGEFTPPVGLSIKDITKVKTVNDDIKLATQKDLESTDQQVEKEMVASEGSPSPAITDKLADIAIKLKHEFTRHFEFLDPKTDGKIMDMLRVYEALHKIAKLKTIQILRGITYSFGRKKMRVFSRYLILGNELRNFKDGIPFKFGLTEEIARADLEKYQKIVDANLDIKEAIDKRNGFMEALRQVLIAKDLLSKEVAGKDYWHQQTLEVYAGKQSFSGRRKDIRLGKKTWQYKRTLTDKNYNTNYFEAEQEVVQTALESLITKKLLEKLQPLVDRSGELKKQAKQLAEQTGRDEDVILKELMKANELVEWRLKKGTLLYKAVTVSEKALDAAIEGTRQLTEEDKKYIFAAGRPATWIVPERMAKTFDNLREDLKEGMPEQIAEYLLSSWKQTILFQPLRFSKYFLNNLSGDLDITLAFRPQILMPKYLMKSTHELFAHYRGKAMTGDLMDFAERDGVSSGMTIQEIPDVTAQGIFKLISKGKGNPISWYFDKVKNVNILRENALRYAAYRFFLEKAKRGIIYHAASNGEEIDAMPRKTDEDLKDIAAKLARELLLDYGNTSVGGQYMAKRIYPFWRWVEGNTPRYVRLFKNAAYDYNQEGRQKSGWKEAGTRTARGTIRGITATSRFLMYALSFYGMIEIWNRTAHTFMPDDFPKEEELSEAQRRQKHLILGRNSDGTVRTIRAQGALSDVFNLLGIEDMIQDVHDVATGQGKSALKITKDVFMAPVQAFARGLHPVAKTLAEVIYGKTFYPDLLHPRPIRDRIEAIAKLWAVDMPYRHIAGKPTVALKEEIRKLLLYDTDAGESAYYTTRGIVSDFKKKYNVEMPAIEPTKKSNALYYYKKALILKDEVAAKKYLTQYGQLGGTYEGLQRSIKMADPFYGMADEGILRLLEEVTPEQKKSIFRGMDWYHTVFDPQ